MTHPTWLPYSFAVVMVAVSVYCIGRLALANRLGRRNHEDVNISHVLMGLAMVGMLVPRWNVVPNVLWEVAFGVIALYFLARSVRFVVRHGLSGTSDDHVHHISHYLIHMVMACAMLYMYWLGNPITVASGSSMVMSGPPNGAGDPLLTLLLIVILFASAVWQLDAISQYSASSQLALSTVGSASGGSDGVQTPTVGDDRPWLAPRLEIGCHIAMCVTMGYMLILMV